MRTLLFIISTLVLLSFDGFSQTQITSEVKKDTIIYKTGYGLRIGADISKPILSSFDNTYNGFEIVGNYRISRKWYIASEIGYEEKNSLEDYTNSTAKGTYIRLGGNLNVYNNWLDMNNEIFVGGRYSFALFDQTINSYTYNINNSYFPPKTITTPITTSNLTAHWLEFQLGLKVETLKNLFVSLHGSFKVGISIDNPNNFKTLYSPGFNRVFSTSTGFGFNYTISYLIPFVNK